MTTPAERTRALRYGGELLIELNAADNLTAAQRDSVTAILKSYPTTDEIEKWALACVDSGALFGSMLAPETNHNAAPKSLDRSPTALRDRIRALQQAHPFFCTLAHAENLTAGQNRAIAVVLRHFPAGYEIGLLARLAP